ncbi:AAA family ATPase [Streptomyces sp. NPDC018031]|uniref:AAA family ATPase n=1 Tax=Streptomyces sp. NPDC018031 TaxID=3365033 RepID=UPI00378A7BCC
MKDWWVYCGEGDPEVRRDRLAGLEAPPWREFTGAPGSGYTPPGTRGRAWDRTWTRGSGYVPDEVEKDVVNTALYLRRPLLVTGRPGVGKSTLAHSIAADLRLGPVLHWPVTSRTTLRDGLYRYDAIGRLQDANLHQMRAPAPAPVPDLAGDAGTAAGGEDDPAPGASITPYLRLGPLGTALLPQDTPRVLLVDEIDKSDIDLPGDLLTVFEEGGFEIPELARLAVRQPSVRIATDDSPDTLARVERGHVRCRSFPIVVLTSNGERDFPPPFLRRCIRLHMEPPGREKLEGIIRSRLRVAPGSEGDYEDLVQNFLTRGADGDLATDQLLNAIHLRLNNAWTGPEDRERFLDTVLQRLTGPAS